MDDDDDGGPENTGGRCCMDADADPCGGGTYWCHFATLLYMI